MQGQQQAALVELGRSALKSIDLSTLLRQAARLVADVLHVEYSLILEPLTDQSGLLLRAGDGWPESMIGFARMDMDEASPAASALRCATPVIVEDWRHETKLRLPALFAEHAIVSSICISIPGPRQALGVLGAASSAATYFSQIDLLFLEAVAVVLGQAIEHAEGAESLRRSESRFRRLAENAPDLIYRYCYGPTPCFDYVSPASVAITGYAPAEYYADARLIVEMVHPDDRAVLEAAMQSPLAVTRPLRLRVLRKDGTLVWTEQRLVPLLSSAGEVIGVEGIVRDITDQTQAVLEERQRLARDLHDSVTQALYGITLYAEVAQRTLSTGDMGTTAGHLSELQRTAQEALSEMRLLIFELRPPVLEQAGLVAALRGRLEAVEGRSSLTTEFHVEGDCTLPAPVEQALYRIAQEALNNVFYHAQACHVSVTLCLQKPTVSLEIADDGIGFDTARSNERGLGLRGIMERVEQLGGHMVLQSAPGQGTQVRVEVSL